MPVDHKYYDRESIELLIEKFNNGTLPKNDWTHEAHLTTGLWFISKYEYFDAVCLLKSGIILLNNSHKTENTSNSGYHETITIFWARIISRYIKVAGVPLIEDLVKDFLNSPLADKNLLFKFYDRQRFMTAKLRAVHGEEDMKIDELIIKKILARV